ncbi:unnamed protein product [Ascophyllum nodosum]
MHTHSTYKHPSTVCITEVMIIEIVPLLLSYNIMTFILFYCYESLERLIGISHKHWNHGKINGGQKRHYPFRHSKWRYPYQERCELPDPPLVMTLFSLPPLFTTDPQPQQLS